MMIDYSGQQIGSYRLTQLLGRGGFASVYLGQHIRIATKQAAIKLLHIFDVDTKKFQQEAETIAALDHPNIIHLIDYDFHDQMPFLVMDYAPDGSLRARHPEGTQVPLPAVVEYVQEIARALEYAHGKNFIHRDIKPDNILIGGQGEQRLGDFGIAMLSQTGRTSLTPSSGVGGTAYYMAPEQSRGKPEKASDQYALGIMAYEWLSGKPPFTEGNAINVQYQHAFEPVPSLCEQLPTLLPAVEQVIMRALAKNPKDRFANVQDFAIALAQASSPPHISSSSEPSLPVQKKPIGTLLFTCRYPIWEDYSRYWKDCSLAPDIGIQVSSNYYHFTSVAWSPDGKRLAAVLNNGIVRWLDALSGKPIQTSWEPPLSDLIITHKPESPMVDDQKSYAN